MNSQIAVAVGLAAILAAVLAPISTLTPAFAAEVPADIVTGASSLTTEAFAPYPINAVVGDTVIWTNRDSQPHTVTSGTGGTPDGNFDSSPNFNPIIQAGQTFSHTFAEAGEFPYYCALHPNQVGTVIVAGSGPGPEPEPEPEPEPVPQEFSVTATADGTDYEITGSGDAMATTATINQGQSVVIEFDGGGEVELTLPTTMIDDIITVNGEDVTVVSQTDAETIISFEVPEGETTVTILAGFVVPEFPLIAAILAATIAGIIGYARFARNSTGFFGRA